MGVKPVFYDVFRPRIKSPWRSIAFGVESSAIGLVLSSHVQRQCRSAWAAIIELSSLFNCWGLC